MVIEIDVDGVILDFWGTFFNCTQFIYSSTAKHIGFRLDDLTEFSLNNLEETKSNLAYKAFNDVSFMTNIKAYPYINDVIVQLYTMYLQGKITKIIINTCVYNEDIIKLRKQRIKELFACLHNILEIQVHYKHKQYNKADVRIEDNATCFEQLENTQYAAKINYLIDTVYNKKCTADVIRVANLQMAVEQLNKLF